MPHNLKYVAFDIETTELLPKGGFDNLEGALGIACAVTRTHDGREKRWHGPEGEDGRLEPMSQADVTKLCKYLYRNMRKGVLPVGWNSTGFDWRVLSLAIDPTWEGICFYGALGSIDIGYQMVTEIGYMTGLDAACRGAGLPGKPEDISGVQVPGLWAESREAQDRVLDYCAHDVEATARLYEHIVTYQIVKWRSKRGNLRLWCPCHWQLQDDGKAKRLLTTREAQETPQPVLPKWMRSPRPRSHYDGWLSFAPQNPPLED